MVRATSSRLFAPSPERRTTFTRKHDLRVAERDQMARYDIPQDAPFTPSLAAADHVATFLRAVYGWMSAGLAITAVTAWLVSGSPAIVMAIATNRLLFWGLVIAQLGIVL